MVTELRHALRQLRATPGFALVAVVSLGLGIGACTAIFSVVNAIAFAPLPYAEPDELLELYASTSPRDERPADWLPPARMEAWLREPPDAFGAIAAYGQHGFVFGRRAEAARVSGAVVTGGFFEILGVPAARGRTLGPADDAPDASPAAVLSDAMWRGRFGADPEVVGRVIHLGGRGFTVVGVMPAGFDRPRGAELWVARGAVARDQRPVAVLGMGRLAPGVSADRARAEVAQRAWREWRADSTSWGGQGVVAVPVEEMDRAIDDGALPLILGAAVLLYLIAMANLTQLFVARALTRSRDAAVRAAVGASAWGVVRPFVGESLLVTGAGGAMGLLLAFWATSIAPAVTTGFGAGISPVVDLRVVGFAVTLAVATALLIGIEPLRQLRAVDVRSLLQHGPAALTQGKRERRSRQALVGAQVALALVLLAAAGVVTKSLRNFLASDTGYDSGRVVVARPDWATVGYGEARQLQLGRAVLERARGRTGIAAAALWRGRSAAWPPPPPRGLWGPEGRDAAAIPPLERLYRFHEVTPSYFATLGISILRGRGFTSADAAAADPVAVVSETAARAWWPGDDAIGKRVRLGPPGEGEILVVVGVAEDAQSGLLGGIGRIRAAGGRVLANLYRPITQAGALPPPSWRNDRCGYCGRLVVALRPVGATDPATLWLRRELSALAPELPLPRVGTLLEEELGSFGGAQLRLNRRLLTGFTTVALALALLGMWGVVADGVSRRTREIGIRRALGARARHVVFAVVGGSAKTALAGTAVGLAAIFALRRVVTTLLGGDYLLVGTHAADPAVLATAAPAVVVIAVLAALAAAHRATRVDPATALRAE